MSKHEATALPRSKSAPEKSRLRQNIESLGMAILVALLVRASIVEAFWVPSGSMLPTIQIGDHLFVNKLAYGMHLPLVKGEIVHWNSPKRGEIVVFTRPGDTSTDLIKRVIAVGGDRVQLKNKRLFINGEEVEDSHAIFKDPRVIDVPKRDNLGPITIPEGKIFMMGDNRDQSFDSRYWGFANEGDVKGRATFIYWSRDSKAGMMPRWERFGLAIR